MVTKKMCLAFAKKWDSVSHIEIVWGKSAHGVWGMGKVFANGMFLWQAACHRGQSPLRSPVPSLLPKLPNLVPNRQPRVQPNLLPRWQLGLQPSLQLESPFLWPWLSMCQILPPK